MKLLVLFLALSAASAVTVYRNEELSDPDSTAMESQTMKRHQRGSVTHAERQARLEETHEEHVKPTAAAFRASETDDQQKSSTSVRHRHQRPSTEAVEGAPRPRRQPQQYSEPQEEHGDHFFQSFQETEEQGGQKLGYSSFVQHNEEDISQEGNIDLKKVAPKSSVSVQMYHAPDQQIKLSQLQQKESAHVKNKNSAAKIYSEAAGSFKKTRQAFQPSEATNFGGSHREGLSAFLTPTTYQPATAGKIRQLAQEQQQLQHQQQQQQQQQRQIQQQQQRQNQHIQPIQNQQQGNFPTFSDFEHASSATDNRANHELFPPFNPQPQMNFRGRAHRPTHQDQREQPKPVSAQEPGRLTPESVKNFTPESISVSMSPSWKSVNDNLEIAASDEATPGQGKVRRPKEASSARFFQEQANFKAQRFDHEKALRSSTPFGVSNVMGGLTGPNIFGEASVNHPQVHEEIVETKHEGFRFAEDVRKPLEVELGSSSTGAITFHTGDKIVKVPKTRTVKAGGLEIPVLTHEEYTKHFGQLPKKQEKTRPVRFASDGRVKNVSPPKQTSHGNHASSFAQFNSISTSQKHQNPKNQQSLQNQHSLQNLQKYQSQQKHNQNQYQQQLQNQLYLQNQLQHQHHQLQQQKQQQLFRPSSPPQNKGSGNVELFQSLGFTLPSRRNVSIVPERQGKVLPEYDTGHPQQFSVSASYKIDRSQNQSK